MASWGGRCHLPATFHLGLQLLIYPTGPQAWHNPPIPGCPPSGPTPPPPHTQTNLSQNHFLLRVGSGTGIGIALGTIPQLAEGSGVGSHPASSRAPQGEAWPPGSGCGAGHQAGVELGLLGLVPAAGRAAVSPKRPPEGSRPPAQRNSRFLR